MKASLAEYKNDLQRIHGKIQNYSAIEQISDLTQQDHIEFKEMFF